MKGPQSTPSKSPKKGVRPMATPSLKKGSYSPHLGYIGRQELKVPNYLFGSGNRSGYAHSKGMVNLLLERTVEEQHKKSRELTEFLRRREMTFSKLTSKGEYRTFAVPCVSTPLPLPKSLFDAMERSAQVLVASLRMVLQDIYGSENLHSSGFVRSLPQDVKKIFINAIEKSPQYFPQLHHPVMKDYPFFDVVGLDLVLTKDIPTPEHYDPKTFSPAEDQDIPFRLLEINAGSPSGASNNPQILENLMKIDPEMMKKLGKIIPNDHFEVLGKTYQSLGKAWTGQPDGVQIILPPGGENGATPEIHQLATYSGLIYADSGQLYRDADGWIRLRTVSGKDPVVNSIYSRVNSDSAIFDLKKKITLRDAESGKPLYMTDPLTAKGKNPGKPIRNSEGAPIPLESHYAIPGAVEAIHHRKLYLGGLNRVLDNKIILSTLCDFAPKFFRKELKALGLDPEKVRPVSPPDTLPSSKESLAEILKDPEDWVIKTPNLSGGNGVYILKTMSPAKRRELLQKVKAAPKTFAYQRLVRIGRIPFPVRSGENEYRYANLAADLRMWTFYGAGSKKDLPRLTHNALVRTAPQEKGPLSSIVNTSKGGGYAPMVVVDDVNHPKAQPVESLGIAPRPVPLPCDLPAFVGAQIVQVAYMVSAMEQKLKASQTDAFEMYVLVSGLRRQCREIISFLHPATMEPVVEMLEALERKIQKTKIRHYYRERNRLRIQVSTVLQKLEGTAPKALFNTLDQIRIFNPALVPHEYSASDRAHDMELAQTIHGLFPEQKELASAIRKLIRLDFPKKTLASASCKSLLDKIHRFRLAAATGLKAKKTGVDFARILSRPEEMHEPTFRILFSGEDTSATSPTGQALVASEEELRTGKLLTETDFISERLRNAKAQWSRILEENKKVKREFREEHLESARQSHFEKFPILKEYQQLLDSHGSTSSPDAFIQFLSILPYARYNIIQFARQKGLDVHELFSPTLMENRISMLNREQRGKQGLSTDHFAGECFARKKSAHGLFSDSHIYLWVAKELHPMVQGYTVGHELIHYHQIRTMMEREVAALKKGSFEFSSFLNFFGNFLGLSSGTIEELSVDSVLDRKPLYGFTDLLDHARGKNWVREMKRSLRNGAMTWNDTLAKYGSLLGYSTDASVQVKVKAIREVIPALENAKNIRFMKDLGLKVQIDEVRSALPTANGAQVERYRPLIERAIYSPRLDWEALRIVASHQYPGVRFARMEKPEENLTLKAPLFAIALGGSYNQTQQQQ